MADHPTLLFARGATVSSQDPRGPEPPRQPADAVRLLDVAAVLYRRRWLLAGTVTLAVGAAALYSMFATPIFEARAGLLIEPDSPRVVNFQPIVQDAQPALDYYETQYQVLRSRAIARETLDRLHLWGDSRLAAPPSVFDNMLARVWPQTWSTAPVETARADATSEKSPARDGDISALLGLLSVSPVKDSRLVHIKVQSADAGFAAKVANGIAQSYIDQSVEIRRQRSEEASKWLTERLGELQQQVDRRQGALQQYRERKDAVSLEDQQNIVVQKLAQLNAAVTSARTERIEKQTLYEQLQAARASGGSLDSLPPVLGNGFIQKLQGDLAGLQSERAQLGQQLGALHPDLMKVDAAIAATQSKLAAEVAKVADGVRNDFLAAQARERGLIAALEQQKKEVLNLNRESIGYGALKRDAETTQQLFEGILQRVKEAELSGELQTSNARLLDVAEPPRAPVWPRTTINLAVALFGGLVAGVGLVVGLEFLNPRIVSANDVGEALGLPLLGITPKLLLGQRAEGMDNAALPPAFRESLRSLRTRILLSSEIASLHTLAVTSTSPREGKTMVASHLAVSLALAGRRVLLVDGDTRRPRLHQMFNTVRSPGLADVINGRATLQSALHESGIKGLAILPAGSQLDESIELLDADVVKKLLARYGQAFDLVVIDSPPTMAVAEASIIANAASAVLFVVAANTTSRDVAQAAIDRLVAAQAHIIGVVLNKADLDRKSEYYYPYFRRQDAEYYLQAPGETKHRRSGQIIDS